MLTLNCKWYGCGMLRGQTGKGDKGSIMESPACPGMESNPILRVKWSKDAAKTRGAT